MVRRTRLLLPFSSLRSNRHSNQTLLPRVRTSSSPRKPDTPSSSPWECCESASGRTVLSSSNGCRVCSAISSAFPFDGGDDVGSETRDGQPQVPPLVVLSEEVSEQAEDENCHADKLAEHCLSFLTGARGGEHTVCYYLCLRYIRDPLVDLSGPVLEEDTEVFTISNTVAIDIRDSV